MRRTVRRLLLPCLILLPCLPGLAQAEDREQSYLGIAFTYHFGFGKEARAAAPASLSFGSLRSSTDFALESTIVHLPIVQVPLTPDARAVLAPVQAAMNTLGLFRKRHRLAPPISGEDCDSTLCAALPDLDAD